MAGKYDYLIGAKKKPVAASSKYAKLIPAKTASVPAPISATKPNPFNPFPVKPAPSLIGGIRELAGDIGNVLTAPFPKQSFNPVEALKTGAVTVKDTLSDTARRGKAAVGSIFNQKATPTERITKAGEAGVGLVNAALLPITAPLQAATRLPVIGSVAEIVNRFFGVLGVVGADTMEGAVHALPISDKTKETVLPLAKEVGALAAQIAGGKAGAAKTGLFKQKSVELAKQIDEGIIVPTVPRPTAKTPVTAQRAGASVLFDDAQTMRGYAKKRGFELTDDGNIIGYHASPEAEVIQHSGELRGAYLAPSKQKAQSFGGPKVVKVVVDPAALEGSYQGAPKAKFDSIVRGEDGVWRASSPPSIPKELERTSAEAVQAPNTRAQALETVAVERKLTDSLGTLPTHDRIDMADQAQLAVDFIARDQAEAVRIARGDRLAPGGVLPESIYTALEIKAVKEGNVELLRDLAQSRLPTAAGQSLKALDSADPYSPVKLMRDIQEAREAATERKTGKKKVQATKEIVLDIKSEVQKSVSKRPSWEEFVKEIQCR